MRVRQRFIDSCDLEKFCDHEIPLIDICKIGLKLNSKKGILLFKLHIYIRLPVNKQLIYPARPSTHLIGWSSYVAQC